MIESDIENQEEELDDKIPDPNHLVKQLDLFIVDFRYFGYFSKFCPYLEKFCPELATLL